MRAESGRGSGSTCRWTLAVIALLVVGQACSRPRPGHPPQDILLVTFEGLRADHCSFAQYPRPTTFIAVDEEEPRAHDLDLIAESGVLFARAFAPSALPTVSLVALHTARSDRRDSVASGVPTLAERLSAAGFDTAAFVMPSASLQNSGLERGFAAFEEHARPLQLLRATLHWLFQERDEDRPHFLWLHIGEAAWPWEWDPLPGSSAEVDFARLFADPDSELEPRTDIEFLRALQRGEVELSTSERRALIAAYDGQIARANAVLRIFLEYYKHGWQDTLVVVAGINGLELGERGYWGVEGSLHDEGLHVPLLLRHPGSLTGRRIFSGVVELADVGPTVLDWFRLREPSGVSGRSLLPLVDSYIQRPFEHRPALAWRAGEVGSARDGRWRLLSNPAGTPPAPGEYAVGEVELYDLERDPRALRNVAEFHPQVVGDLRAALERGSSP